MFPVLYLGLWSILSWFFIGGSNNSLVSFFCIWLSHFPSTIYWRSLPFFIVCFGSFVKNYLLIYRWVYFLALNCVPLVSVLIFRQYHAALIIIVCSIIWSQIEWYLCSFFPELLWLLWPFLVTYQSDRIFVLFLQKISFRFWWGLH